MSLRGLSYYEQHFFLTNRLVQLLIGLRPSQSSHEQLLLVSVVTLYVLPAIMHQFYQLFISDVTLEVNVKELQKMLSGISILYVYSTTYFSFVTMKFIIIRFKEDYDQLSDENELNIFKNYTKQSKLYTYIIIVFSNFYIFLNIFPYILNVFFHIFGTLDDNELTLPIPVNNILKPGMLYYSLLIYQMIIFKLSEILHNALETMDCCIIIIGTVLVLYLNFYVGQKLLDHSNAIFEELRQVPFNNLTIKTQKMLLFMITRSMKPCVLSIGGMFISSHEVFSVLMQKALSFATVYHSIR
uniref:Odorant receptor n=1 Tax=Vespula pensylvanica TaxID=30213 RepID=A0A834KSE7_VESPE|nr:hypothetical protein H0235_013648 [Vespula pensylvanica]